MLNIFMGASEELLKVGEDQKVFILRGGSNFLGGGSYPSTYYELFSAYNWPLNKGLNHTHVVTRNVQCFSKNTPTTHSWKRPDMAAVIHKNFIWYNGSCFFVPAWWNTNSKVHFKHLFYTVAAYWKYGRNLCKFLRSHFVICW